MKERDDRETQTDQEEQIEGRGWTTFKRAGSECHVCFFFGLRLDPGVNFLSVFVHCVSKKETLAHHTMSGRGGSRSSHPQETTLYCLQSQRCKHA